jgi:hypothetical protein
VEDEQGRLLNLAGMSEQRRSAIAKTLLSLPGAVATTSSATAGAMQGRRAAAKAVYRHLRDGDTVLVNRQPTLHKPGLMAHTARVLKGEKTIRMHYANCRCPRRSARHCQQARTRGPQLLSRKLRFETCLIGSILIGAAVTL